MAHKNKGFDPTEIEALQKRMSGKSFLPQEQSDENDEYSNFLFIGMYEGKQVIYDAAIYTLKLHYNSEVYELAEHKAAQKFPEFKKISYNEDENGDLKLLDDEEEEIGLYMAEIMMDIEEEGSVKVKEFIELDPNIDYGIGLDAALNVEAVTEGVIEKFIRDFNEENLKLDDTYYSFQLADEDF
jgi:hypothetical protein